MNNSRRFDCSAVALCAADTFDTRRTVRRYSASATPCRQLRPRDLWQTQRLWQ